MVGDDSQASDLADMLEPGWPYAPMNTSTPEQNFFYLRLVYQRKYIPREALNHGNSNHTCA